MTAGCVYVREDTLEWCGGAATRAMSVRQPVSDQWSLYPACPAHEVVLSNEMVGMGYVVTEYVALVDRAGRQHAREQVDLIWRAELREAYFDDEREAG